jgi:hypothetical protein
MKTAKQNRSRQLAGYVSPVGLGAWRQLMAARGLYPLGDMGAFCLGHPRLWDLGPDVGDMWQA